MQLQPIYTTTTYSNITLTPTPHTFDNLLIFNKNDSMKRRYTDDPATAAADKRRRLGLNRITKVPRTDIPPEPSRGETNGYTVEFRTRALQHEQNHSLTGGSSLLHWLFNEVYQEMEESSHPVSQEWRERTKWFSWFRPIVACNMPLYIPLRRSR